MGDEGLSQCAGKCDAATGCVGYSMLESGQCTMLTALNVSAGCIAVLSYFFDCVSNRFKLSD